MVDSFVVIGHDKPHWQKRVYNLEHYIVREPWLKSRMTLDPDGDTIRVWGRYEWGKK